MHNTTITHPKTHINIHTHTPTHTHNTHRFIDNTLQLSNLPALSGYLFGGSSGSNILGRWDGDVVAGAFDELTKQVRVCVFWLVVSVVECAS